MGVMDGVRVVEVASWTHVPAAGAVLAEWGADVIKVEHPVTGDPQRGLSAMGLVPQGPGGVDYMIELPNRGKKSVGIDLTTPDGREALLKLVVTADVFLTNYLPPLRKKLGIELEDIRAANPNIIYVRGSGHGERGPEKDKGAYDGSTFWGRVIAAQATPADRDWPLNQPFAAFGDLMGGLTTIGHPELADDPKYKDAAARFENRKECITTLDSIFAEKTFDEWREILANAKGVWEPVETPGELLEDEQALANGYVRHITLDNGTSFRIVPSPLQFNEQPPDLVRAPLHGEHTDEVLQSVGYDMDQLIDMKVKGAIL